jgi:hypothetical protein
MPLMISANSYKKLLAATAAAMIAGCDGGFHIAVRVVDSEGHAIPGAKVVATSEKSTEKFTGFSDSRGCLSLGRVIAPGKYDFTVSVIAPGYKSLQFTAPTLQYRTYQVVLAKPEQAFNSQSQELEGVELKNHCGCI